LVFFFFFQAEDGIRDFHVTGVQTCALPILLPVRQYFGRGRCERTRISKGALRKNGEAFTGCLKERKTLRSRTRKRATVREHSVQIGRASCRERVEVWVAARRGNQKNEGHKA